MIRRLRPRSLYDVLAALASLGVVAGGTAYAANTVFSTDIVDGQVKTVDLANNAVVVGEDRQRRGHRRQGQGRDPSPARDVAPRTRSRAPTSTSRLCPASAVAAEPRARMASSGRTEISPRSKNVTGDAVNLSGEPPSGGTYCVPLAGSIDASTAVAITQTDFRLGRHGSVPSLGWAKAGRSGCTGNAIYVQTGILPATPPTTASAETPGEHQPAVLLRRAVGGR